jgi:hypothetical protein
MFTGHRRDERIAARERRRTPVKSCLFGASVGQEMLTKIRQQFWRICYIVPHAFAEIAKGVEESTVMSGEKSVIFLFHSFSSTRFRGGNPQLWVLPKNLVVTETKNHATVLNVRICRFLFQIPISAKK